MYDYFVLPGRREDRTGYDMTQKSNPLGKKRVACLVGAV